MQYDYDCYILNIFPLPSKIAAFVLILYLTICPANVFHFARESQYLWNNYVENSPILYAGKIPGTGTLR